MANLETKKDYKIALWGPTASGKTWYINAFSRRLRDFQDDPDFSYELMEGDNTLYELLQEDQEVKLEIPVSIKPDATNKIEPTQGINDHVWIFRRQKKGNSSQHNISSFSHQIHIVDDKGDDTVKLRANATVVNFVSSADFIVMMLDPTKLTTFSSGLGESHEPHQYAEMVAELFDALIAKPHSKRYIAVCVAKIDQLQVRQRDPWELIQMFFEHEMYDTLKSVSNQKDKFSLETFAVSSMGFIKEGRTISPNYDVTTGQLIKPGEWRPYNVEAPLFWLFENIERLNLRNPTNSGFLGKLLFQPERENQYVPYPIKRN